MASFWVNTLRLTAVINSLLLGQATFNTRGLLTPRIGGFTSEEAISVLVPVRNEADNVVDVLKTITSQVGCPKLEVLVADDASTDDTALLVGQFAKNCPVPIGLISLNEALPPGWLGKTRACQELANVAQGDILVFVDADVRLAPNALQAAASLLRERSLGMVSPYPRQIATSLLARLIQPLLQWSWLTFLPLRFSESQSSPRSLTAANGQFLICDARAYSQAGGHASVSFEVIEDVALARTFKQAGFRVAMANGTELATCQMYSSDDELITGYSKSLWRAFGSAKGALAVSAGLFGLFVLPLAGVFVGGRQARRTGLISYAAAVGQRAISAKTTGGRLWPDCLWQPLSISVLIGMIGRSIQGNRRQTLTWRGRKV